MSCRWNSIVICNCANTEKNIPPAMSQRFQTTWCFGKVWQHAGGAGDLQSATVFPGFLPFRYTCKSIAFWQSCAIFRKKGLSGPQVLPRSGPNSEDEQSHPVIAQIVNPNGMTCPSPNLQQLPSPAAAAEHKDQPNPMSSRTMKCTRSRTLPT